MENPAKSGARKHIQEHEEYLIQPNLSETYKRYNQKRKKKIWSSYFILKKRCNILKFMKKAVGKKSGIPIESNITKENIRIQEKKKVKPLLYYC
jgi:hypothetical protein